MKALPLSNDEKQIFAKTRRRLFVCSIAINCIIFSFYLAISALFHPNQLLKTIILVLVAGGVWLTCLSLYTDYVLRPGREGMSSIRQFTEEIGHELATPLSLMKSQIQLIARRHQDDLLGTDIILLEEGIETMVSLVDDIRVLSSLEAYRRHPELSIISMDLLLKDTISAFTSDFNSAKIQLSYEDIEPVSIIADKDGLVRAFSNLLKNALLYVSAGGTVTVKLKRAGDCVCLIVSDNGCGVGADEINNIFDRFYRSSAVRESSIKGTGLGLTIVKTIIDAHGGTIIVSSEPKKGVEYTIRLPRFPKVHPLASFLSTFE